MFSSSQDQCARFAELTEQSFSCLKYLLSNKQLQSHKNQSLRAWHIHVNNCSRAFANPNGICQKLELLKRGWKPFEPMGYPGSLFSSYWWSKPSRSNNYDKAM